MRPLPGQHRDLPPVDRRRAPAQRGHLVADPGRLVDDRRVQRHDDLPGTLAARARRQVLAVGVRALPGLRGADRDAVGHQVGGGEHRLTVAEAHRQPARPGLLRTGEVGPEPLEVAGTRTAPPVDRLPGVADRGHGMAAGEQRGEQDPLGLAGVLVLVEQHRAEPAALDLADLGVRPGDPGRDRHLVAVVHRAAVALERRVGAHHRQQRQPRLEQAKQVGHVLVVPRRALTRCPRQPDQVRADPVGQVHQVVGLAQVLGQLAGQREDVPDHGGDGPVDGVHGTVVRLDDLGGVLPAHGLADQPGARLEPDPQRVLADQRRGVGVVGGHRRLAGAQRRGDLVGEERDGVVGVPQPAEHPADPFAQLGGRLAGERQPQHPVRLDQPVGDQPDHPQAHGLGLARAGSGDDHVRAQRRRDRRGLLRRRRVRLPEAVRELGRRQQCALAGRRVEQGRLVAPGAGRGHPVTARPSSCTGQLVRTGHIAQ